jgi:hypothetical protein
MKRSADFGVRAVVAAVPVVLALACVGGDGAQADDPVGVVQAALVPPDVSLQPSDVEVESALIDGWFDLSAATNPDQFHPSWPHDVYCPTDAGSDKLLVFLPGTGNAPSKYDAFLQHAAAHGFHVIGLSYWNLESVNDLCAKAHPKDRPAVAACIEEARDQVWNGGSPADQDDSVDAMLPTLITAENQDAIQAAKANGNVFTAIPNLKFFEKESFGGADAAKLRLLMLLRVLSSFDPSGSGSCSNANWSQFVKSSACFAKGLDVSNCDLAWGKITLGGHSAGSGMSGAIGTFHAPARVLLFSGPEDGPDAGWVAKQKADPSRYFGLLDIGDVGEGNRVGTVVATWNALGIPGSVDPSNLTAPITTISRSQHQALMNMSHKDLGMDGHWASGHAAPVVDSDDGTPPPAELQTAWTDVAHARALTAVATPPPRTPAARSGCAGAACAGRS